MKIHIITVEEIFTVPYRLGPRAIEVSDVCYTVWLLIINSCSAVCV